MIDDFEKNILRNYLMNLLSDIRMTRKMFSEICDWLEDHLENIIVGDVGEETWQVLDDFSCALKERSEVKAKQKRVFAEITKLLSLAKEVKDDVQPSRLELSLAMLAREMELEESNKIIFNMLARYKIHDILNRLSDNLGSSGATPLQTISLLTGLNQKIVTERLSINGHLVSSGLIRLKTHNGNDVDDRFDLPDAIANALRKTSDNPDDIRTHIIGAPAKAELSWDDFSHLGEIRSRLASFLKKSMQQKLAGINILLWGATWHRENGILQDPGRMDRL